MIEESVTGPTVTALPKGSRLTLRSARPSTERVSGSLSSGVKRPGREAHHLHLLPRLIMNNVTAPPIYLNVVHCDKFIFTFTY